MPNRKNWTIETLIAGVASGAGDLALRALDARRSEKPHVMIDPDVIESVAIMLLHILPHLQRTGSAEGHEIG